MGGIYFLNEGRKSMIFFAENLFGGLTMNKVRKILAVAAAITALSGCVAGMTACSGGSAELDGSYWYTHAYIWFDQYQKNLVGSQVQNLDLYDDGTYVLSISYECLANMDNTPVTNAPYDPFYYTKLSVKGTYEEVSSDPDLGDVTIKLVNAEVVSCFGNFGDTWYVQNDDGTYNFTLAINNTEVTYNTSTGAISDLIEVATLNA